jgi:hypothetical protein
MTRKNSPWCCGKTVGVKNSSRIRRRRVSSAPIGVKVKEEFSMVVVVSGWRGRHPFRSIEGDSSPLRLLLLIRSQEVPAGVHLAEPVSAGTSRGGFKSGGPTFGLRQKSGNFLIEYHF